MPLYGTLGTMPLEDLLRWIERGKNTGTLKVERNRVRKWVVFRDGRIVSVSSDAPPERLGHFLLAQGRIDETQLREALRRQETSGKPLGRLFVETGALTDDELRSHLQAQAEESLYGVFEWPEAVFRFQEEVEDAAGFPVSLAIDDILRKGRERCTELARIRAIFPDHEIVLRHGSRRPPEAVLQTAMARKLYDAIDGNRTISEILVHVHGSEFMVTRFLCELQRAGFIEIGAAQAATAIGGHDPDPPPAAAPAATAAALAEPPPPTAVARPAAGEVDPVAILNTPSSQTLPPDAPPLDELEWDDDPLDEHSEILDIPDLFAESSDVEAIEDSIPHQVDRKLAEVRRQLSANQFEAALTLLDELYGDFPDDDALRRLMAEAEVSFRDMAYRHYVPAHMIPTLKMQLDQFEGQNLSPSEYFLLSRINGTWDVKSIIQVAPIREVEALMTLKRMREEGLIELRDPPRMR